MSTPPQPSSAHIHPNTRAHTLPAYHCETGHLPCICAAELPHQSPLPDTHDQQLYHEIARLTRLNAALEDEVFNQYEEIDRLRARNEVLQDCWGACDMGRMDWMGDSSMGSCRSTAGSDTDDAATDAATVEKFGLRQIETELSVLNLQSETALLSMQISRLEKQFVLLGEEMRSLGRCVGVIAEVVGGVRNVDDEEEEGSASPGPGSSAGLGVRSMAGVKSPVCVCFPENLAMRGGMGGRDEDEEFVYGYWGYTNWDQVEEEERSSGSGNGMACEGRYNDQGAETSRAGGWQSRNANAEQGESMEVDMAHIHELQHQIARLENQIQRLGDSLSTKPEASSPPVSQNPSEPPDSPPEESAKELPPHIRGGSGHLSLHPSLQPLIHPSNSSENFSHLYAHLLHHTSSTCTQCPSSDCTEAWMSLATVLQTHNAFLEREVEEFKKMSESLMGDVRWQMGNLGKLEELCEGLEQERDLLLREVEELKKTVERSDNRGFQSEEIAQEAIERGVWDMHASAADDEIEQSTPKTSKSHVHHTAFIYRPSPSYIIFPTTPPQIFHFPSAPTLPLIYALLNHRRTHVGEDNPYLMRVREILDVRTAMGISLPDSFEEEEIEVGIPDLLFSEWEDGDVEIAAWKSGELDLRDVGGFLERLVLDDEKECEEENRGEWAEVNHYGDLCTETMSETGSAKGSSDGGLCICSDCTGEERDKEFNGDQQPETPGVAIRGSGYEQYASSSADPKNGLEPEQGEYGCEWDEYILPRSSRGVYIAADFLLRPTTPAPSPPKATKAVKSEALTQESQASHVIDLIYDKDSWQHPKGRGCEEWATFPDRNRQRCTLCHLPFSRQDLLKRSSSVESIAYEDDAPIPTSIPPFPSPLESDKVINKTDCINSKQSILDDTNAHLRGGAAVSDTSESEYSNHSAHSAHEDDWRTEWNDLADQNHHSKHQHQTFRNYNTLSTKETGKPVTPIARQNPHPRLDLPSLFDERGNKRFNAWSIGYQGLKPGAEDVMQEVKKDVLHSKIPPESVLQGRRLDDDGGATFKKCNPTRQQIWSTTVPSDFSDRAQGPWKWFEHPRPAPAIPLTHRDVKTKASIRIRLSHSLISAQALNKKFATSARSRGVKAASISSSDQPHYTTMRPLQLVGRNVKRSTGDMQNQKSVLEKQRISICEIFQLSKPRPHINDNTYTTSPRFATHTEETNLHNTSVTTDYALQTSQAPKTSTSSTNHTQAMTSYLSKTALPLLRLQIYKPLPPTPEPWVPHTIAGPSYITQNVGRDV